MPSFFHKISPSTPTESSNRSQKEPIGPISNENKNSLNSFWHKKIVPYLVKEPSSSPQNSMSHQEGGQKRSIRELSVVFKWKKMKQENSKKRLLSLSFISHHLTWKALSLCFGRKREPSASSNESFFHKDRGNTPYYDKVLFI